MVDSSRLPTDVKPTHYNLTIKTDLEKLKFQGYIVIDLEILKDTSSLTFHALNFTVHQILLCHPPSHVKESPTEILLDEKTERITVKFSQLLTKGSKVQLSVRYAAKLLFGGGMTGYYPSSYEEEGSTHYYSLTQFEATAARRAFPCWDEPLFKATYDITLISRDDTVNLSNMPSISEKAWVADLERFPNSDAIGWKVTNFQTTPPMSSYLVAFANGPFKYIESSYRSPLSGVTRPLRVYATKDLIHQAQFCLDVKAKVLPLYEQVFDIEFPLPKLDTLIAHDFDAEAMENWGLIAGRQSGFLLDPKRINLEAKQKIAKNQSHEVGHMWFGNITTMSWWDNLWLNEGFASLMGEVIILNKVFPEWRLYSAFNTAHFEAALTLDAKAASHAIKVEVPNANEISQFFDALSYSKAASILRMLSFYVGEARFLKGVSIYLKSHLYGSSVDEDLWKGVQQATGLDVPQIMKNWISKTGYPVITVKETPEGIHIRQDRFLVTGPPGNEDNETIWHVPLTILKTSTDGEVVVDNQVLLNTREMTYQLDAEKAWILNAGRTGFYRVLYTPERLRKLAANATIPGTVISLEDRLGLISDAMVLASSGLAATSNALDLINFLRVSEFEYLVWSGIAQQLTKLRLVWWEQHPAFEDLDAFRQALFKPIVRRLGYAYAAGESVDTAQLRTLAVTQAAEAGSPDVVGKLKGWFEQFIITGSDEHIPPDLIGATFNIGMKYGGRREWEVLRGVYFKPKTPSVRLSAVYAMCSALDLELIEDTLRFMKDQAQDQDVMYFFDGLSANVRAGRKPGEFFKENYDHFYERFKATFNLATIIKRSHGLLSTYQDADELEKFFKGKDTSRFSTVIPQMLETIRANAGWLERSTKEVAAWLARYRHTTSPSGEFGTV